MAWLGGKDTSHADWAEHERLRSQLGARARRARNPSTRMTPKVPSDLETRLPTQLNRPLAAAGPQGTAPATTLAGLGWIIVAFLAGYLAVGQWSYSIGRAGAETFQAFAVVNLASAIASLAFGLLLLWRPTRGQLTSSIAWAAVVCLIAVFQAASGTNDRFTFYGTMIGALWAAAMSWAARPATARA